MAGIQKFTSARHGIEKILGGRCPAPADVDPEAEVNKYLEHLRARLNISEESLVAYRAEYLPEVVSRAINRVRPCSDDGEEIRDAILWLTVKDVAKNDGDFRTVFISRNTRQFAGENKELHQSLREEAEREGLEVHYYPDLTTFIVARASAVDYVTEDWLSEHLSVGEIKNEVLELVESNGNDPLIDWALRHRHQPTGRLSVEGADIELDNFYGYEMTNGEFRIGLTYAGSLRVEFEMIAEGLIGCHEPDGRATEARTVTLRPEVRVEAEAISSGESEGVRHVAVYNVEY